MSATPITPDSLDPVAYRGIETGLKALRTLVWEMNDRDLVEVAKAKHVIADAHDCPNRDGFESAVQTAGLNLQAALEQLNQVITTWYFPRREDISHAKNACAQLRVLHDEVDAVAVCAGEESVDSWTGSAAEAYRGSWSRQVGALQELAKHLSFASQAQAYLAQLTSVVFRIAKESIAVITEYLDSVHNPPSRASEITNGLFNNSYSRFRYMTRTIQATHQIKYLAAWLDRYAQSNSRDAQEWATPADEAAWDVLDGLQSGTLLRADGGWPEVSASGKSSGTGSRPDVLAGGDDRAGEDGVGEDGAGGGAVKERPAISHPLPEYLRAPGRDSPVQEWVDIDRRYRPWD